MRFPHVLKVMRSISANTPHVSRRRLPYREVFDDALEASRQLRSLAVGLLLRLLTFPRSSSLIFSSLVNDSECWFIVAGGVGFSRQRSRLPRNHRGGLRRKPDCLLELSWMTPNPRRSPSSGRIEPRSASSTPTIARHGRSAEPDRVREIPRPTVNMPASSRTAPIT